MVDVFGLLPDELLVQIFRWLDGETLVEVVPAVCARWARAVVWTPGVTLALLPGECGQERAAARGGAAFQGRARAADRRLPGGG